MPKVKWVMSYGFYSKFHVLSSSAKSLKFKGGNLLRHSIVVVVVLVVVVVVDLTSASALPSEKKKTQKRHVLI